MLILATAVARNKQQLCVAVTAGKRRAGPKRGALLRASTRTPQWHNLESAAPNGGLLGLQHSPEQRHKKGYVPVMYCRPCFVGWALAH
ncbi:MAG: hypothetical protein WA173_15410, partial [Pseudomonas sp.]|uniref:hypothetical protein n=1 Tax=Pseudomonas sp. TaxID=306 RepID=UPI003BB5569D